MNSKNKKVLWVILLLIGLIPFVITVHIGIEAAINGDNGFCADCPEEFGLTAFCGVILTAFVLFTPVYVVAITMILLAILKLKGVNSIHTKKIVWGTLLIMLLVLLILPWTVGSFWMVYIIPVIILAIILLVRLRRKTKDK